MLAEEILVGRCFGVLEVWSQEQGKSLAQWGDLPPKEAIAWFRARRVVGPDTFKAMSADAKRQAFAVAGLNQRYAAHRAHQVLADALESGEAQATTVKRLREVFASSGLAAPTRHHLNVVARNNIQGAYAHGRWQQMKRIASRRPLWRYMTVGDDHVRPSHRAMHGVTRRHDDALWQQWTPPCGHQCRCRIESLREDDATASEDLPDVRPDPGWGGSPDVAQSLGKAHRRVDQAIERGGLLRPPRVATRGGAVHVHPGDLRPGQAAARARVVDRISGLSAKRARELAADGPFSVGDAPGRLRRGQMRLSVPLPSQLDLVHQVIDRLGTDPALRHLVPRLSTSTAASYEAGSSLAPHLVSHQGLVRGTALEIRVTVSRAQEARAMADLLRAVERGGPDAMRSALDVSPVIVRGLSETPPGYAKAVLNWRKEGKRHVSRLTKRPLPGFNAEDVLISRRAAKGLP